MRLSVRIIATTAFAFLLMSASSLFAEETATPSAAPAGNDRTAASGVAVVAPTAVMLASPAMPDAPLQAAAMPGGGMSGAPHHSGERGKYTPKVELFLGYSYLRAVPNLAAGNRLVWLNGGSTSVAFNLNRYLGVVGDFGGFDDTQLRLGGTAGIASAVVDSSGTVFTYLLGPRLSYRNSSRVTPFAQLLFGAIHASDVTISSSTGCTGAGCTPLLSETSFAMTAGGGVDLRIHHHLAIRLIQAEYLMTRFDSLTSGTSASQNDVRLSSGIVFRFGGSHPPPAPGPLPLAFSCSINPIAVFPGEPITVSGTAQNLDPTKTPLYSWSVDSGTVSGTSTTASIDTTSSVPGSYTVKGHVSEGSGPGQSADCASSYTIKMMEPPTVSCMASPGSVTSGDSSTVTAVGVSPSNRPLTYSYSSSSGSISGSGSTAALSTVGIVPGSITVTCNVIDDKSQSASNTTVVMVVAPAVVAKPLTRDLCAIHFERDARRPSRVDNEAKACLDDVALSLQSNPDAQLAIVGNAATRETGGGKLAAARATNTKAYLVEQKSIDASRIIVYSGSQDGKIVSTTLVPPGATFDSAGDTLLP